MVTIGHIDYHLVDSCNLACDFCSHYSNFKGPSNMVSVDQAREEWLRWSKVIRPQRFHLIGGEPLLNPNLVELVRLAFDVWKDSMICLYSNGLLIDRHPELKEALSGGHYLLSLHYGNEKDEQIESNVRRFFQGSNVGIHILVTRKSEWLSFYQFDKDGKLIPYNDGDQRKSWENCIAGQSRCFVLRKDRLWKCPQVAFADRAKITWFDDYKSCSIEDDIQEWALREDESCCSNCPASKQVVPHGEQWMVRR